MSDVEKMNYEKFDGADEPLVAQRSSSTQRTQRQPRRKNKMKRKRKIAHCFLVTCVFIITLLITSTLVYIFKTLEHSGKYTDHTMGPKVPDIEHKNPSNTKNIQNILIWSNSIDWDLPGKYVSSRFLEHDLQCKVYNCNINVLNSTDHNKKYDAIVFDADDHRLIDWISMQKKYSSAIWIYGDRGLTRNRSSDNLTINSNLKFDLTLSYRTDADIVWTRYEVQGNDGVRVAPAQHPKWYEFNRLSRFLQFETAALKYAIQSRKHFAIAHMCDNTTIGAQMYEELKNYLPTLSDVYVNITCETSYIYSNLHLGEYKFVFAFEDKLCTDNISELFYKAISSNVIPVVLGQPTVYTNFAPPHSFIKAEDFNSVLELAEYLVHLDENIQEYIEYFWWQKYYNIVWAPSPFCRLCEILHEKSQDVNKQEQKIEKNWFTAPKCLNTTSLLSS